MNDNNVAEELIISCSFPPSNDVGGMVLAKRCIVENKHVDVIQVNVKKDKDLEFNKVIEKHINERILIDIKCNSSSSDWNYICNFVDKSMDKLEKRNVYKKIYSRVWRLPNNFLSLEYKFKHPDTYWTAEFSDPLLYDTFNKKRGINKPKINDSEFLDKTNAAITELNEQENTNFELLENDSNPFMVVEYIAYLFADEIVFTNENQRKIMLEQFPVDVKDFVMKKSIIKPHPTLPKEFYNIKNYEEDFDSSMINLGFFGRIYSKRHFESVFNAFEILNHKYKDRLQFYFYTDEKHLINKITKSLEIHNNLHVKNKVDYLDFLSLINKLDILIINDLITKDCFDVNPYLPSKFSDYRGSDSKIWAICEKGSSLEKADAEYKSYIDDYNSNVDILVEILNDYSFGDESYELSDEYEYLLERITELNIIIDEDNKRIKRNRSELKKLKKKNEKLEKENKKLNNENKEILSSNSWKLTGFLRKIKRFFSR